MGQRDAVRRRHRCSQGSTAAARELDRLCGPVAVATTGAARTEGTDDRGRAGQDGQMTTARVRERVYCIEEKEKVLLRARAQTFPRLPVIGKPGRPVTRVCSVRVFLRNTAVKKIHNRVHNGRVRV